MKRGLCIFIALLALLPALARPNGNPVNLVDPFGLGAREAAQGSTWFQGIQDQMSQWQEQYGGLTFEQQVSALLNMTPFVGAFKQAGETFAGKDFVTGASIDDPWSHAGAATLNLGLSFASFGGGAVESGFTARSSIPFRSVNTAAETGAGVKYIGTRGDLEFIPRGQTLLDDLSPSLGSPRANYYRNSTVLRKALRDGFEIRDASVARPNSELYSSPLRPNRTVGQSFLGAERNILDNKGLKLSPSGVYVPK